MGSKRMKGSTLSLKIDGTEYRGDLTSWTIKPKDKDASVTTFEDVAAGSAKAFEIELGFVQSLDPESMFQNFWENAGQEVPYVLAPAGNETPTAAQPHYTGQLTIPYPDEFGGEAGTEEWETKATADLDGKPTKVTGAGGGE